MKPWLGLKQASAAMDSGSVPKVQGAKKRLRPLASVGIADGKAQIRAFISMLK